MRNHLNLLEMEIMLLGDLNSHPDVVAAACRIRLELAESNATVKTLVFKFDEPRTIAVAAGDLMRMWKIQMAP